MILKRLQISTWLGDPTNCYIVLDEQSKEFYNKYNVLYKKTYSAESIEDKIKLCEDRKHRFFYVMNKLYKKSLIKENEILFPEKSFFEDVIFSIKAIHHAKKIVSCPSTKYHYNLRYIPYFNFCFYNYFICPRTITFKFTRYSINCFFNHTVFKKIRACKK